MGVVEAESRVEAVTRRIAFAADTENNLDIYVMNEDGSHRTRMTSHPAIDQAPSWSPNADNLAFLSNRNGSFDLYLIPVDGGEVQPVTGGMEVVDYAWAPDGQSIAIVSAATDIWQIHVVDLRDLSTQPVSLKERFAGDPMWSPDGSLILYASYGESGSELRTATPDGAEPTTLWRHPEYGIRQPQWSPDGTKILFNIILAIEEGIPIQGGLYLIDAAGSSKAETLVDDEEWCNLGDGAWSPDGVHILSNCGLGLSLIDWDSKEITRLQLEEFGNDLSPTWTPEGQHIVAPEYGGSADDYTLTNFYLVNLELEPEEDLLEGVVGYLSWSPPMPLLTGNEVIIADPVANPLVDSDPLPAEGLIAFNSRPSSDTSVSETQVYLMQPDGSGRKQLSGSDTGETDPIWSPDGSRLLVTRDRNLFVIERNGTYEYPITYNSDFEWGARDRAKWSPDGTSVLFESHGHLFVVGSDGQGKTQITDDSFYIHSVSLNYNIMEFTDVFDWSPSGEKIVFLKMEMGNADLYLINADGSEVKPLVESAGDDFAPTWSPDGEWIAFISSRNDPQEADCDTAMFVSGCNTDLYLIRADGSEQIHLLETPREESVPVWSPDGRYLGFT
jgi:Tol biopolymer transport system component